MQLSPDLLRGIRTSPFSACDLIVVIKLVCICVVALLVTEQTVYTQVEHGLIPRLFTFNQLQC